MKEILEVKLYNVPEAAALLEVTSQTVRKAPSSKDRKSPLHCRTKLKSIFKR
jgi:hypothetical protein